MAGDMLPNATLEQKIATGFHRNTQINQEGGIDPEQFRVESVVDRVNTTATAFLGITLGCAQCHDHKFDPYSQEDFYSMQAFFADVDLYGSFQPVGSNSLPTPHPCASGSTYNWSIQPLLKAMIPARAPPSKAPCT